MQPMLSTLPSLLPDQTPTHPMRIVVAMSGGVDSSTVAAMLHHQGHEVIGMTLQLYDIAAEATRRGSCCAGKDIYDAKHVAETLGFAHYVLNYEAKFHDQVMMPFAESYMHGETPIPCVLCNQTVKFNDLLRLSKTLGADALATGHYVRRVVTPQGEVQMHRGVDTHKDQSYFLFSTTHEQLGFTHFPLGGLTKEATRALAVQYGLPVADKPDSQDICFVQGRSYTDIVAKLQPGALEPGEIVHLNGTVLGTHQGVMHYTIGQRRGLGIAWPDPLYVVRILPASRQVVVGPLEALGQTQCILHSVNWLCTPEALPSTVMVRIRSLHAPVPARIIPFEPGYVDQTPVLPLAGPFALVQLEGPQPSITPGQACVFYDGTRVLGGGWICRPDTVRITNVS